MTVDHDIFVSIIVPVYNVADYLPQCLESIVAQTLSNIEVILVDDGSSDDSPAICDKYAKKYKNVNVIHQKNQGLGMARNKGIEIARGEYLGFVDSDDYIDENYYEVLYNTAKSKNADIVEIETVDFDKINTKIRKSFDLVKDINVMPETIEHFFKEYYFSSTYKHNAWDKIYKREFINKHNVKFGDNKVIYAEDTWFQLQAIFYYPKICFIQGSYYRYRLRLSSITHNAANNLVQRESLMIKMYDNLLRDNIENRVIEQRACSVIAVEVLTLEALNQIHHGGDRSKFIKETNKVLEMPIIKRYLEGIYKTKAYELEPKKGRRLFLKVIGMLFSWRLYGLARYVVWGVYKRKEKLSVDLSLLYN